MNEFDGYVKPKDRVRIESISMPPDYWVWVDRRARRTGSSRSKVIRALIDYVRAKETVEAADKVAVADTNMTMPN